MLMAGLTNVTLTFSRHKNVVFKCILKVDNNCRERHIRGMFYFNYIFCNWNSGENVTNFISVLSSTDRPDTPILTVQDIIVDGDFANFTCVSTTDDIEHYKLYVNGHFLDHLPTQTNKMSLVVDFDTYFPTSFQCKVEKYGILSLRSPDAVYVGESHL